MNSARLLKIIFVILLLVTFGELGYYLYIQFSVKNNREDNGGNKITVLNTVTSSPMAISENEIGNKVNKIKIGDNTLNTYGSLINSFLNKFEQQKALTVVLDVEFEGIVGNVQRDSNGIATAFSVIDGENKQIIKYELSDSMKFWRSGTGKKLESIEPKELETGQNVHIKDRIDLLKGSRFTGVSISIL